MEGRQQHAQQQSGMYEVARSFAKGQPVGPGNGGGRQGKQPGTAVVLRQNDTTTPTETSPHNVVTHRV